MLEEFGAAGHWVAVTVGRRTAGPVPPAGAGAGPGGRPMPLAWRGRAVKAVAAPETASDPRSRRAATSLFGGGPGLLASLTRLPQYGCSVYTVHGAGRRTWGIGLACVRTGLARVATQTDALQGSQSLRTG